MRFFAGLDINSGIRERIGEYIQQLQEQCPDCGGKWVRPESLHVTLKFIGESSQVDAIQQALKTVHAPRFEFAVRGCGFFTPATPRIFWAGIEGPEELPALANDVDAAVATCGVPRETHAYQPHLTLARAGTGRPHGERAGRSRGGLQSLIKLLEGRAQPEFGTMTAEEFFLFKSETLPGGARYTKIATFPLGRNR